MKLEYHFLNNLLRNEALSYLDTGIEKTRLSSLFDKVIITNEGSWEGYITQVCKSLTVDAEGYNTFFISDKLDVLDIVHD